MFDKHAFSGRFTSSKYGDFGEGFQCCKCGMANRTDAVTVIHKMASAHFLLTLKGVKAFTIKSNLFFKVDLLIFLERPHR